MVHIETVRIGNVLKKEGIIFMVTPVTLIDIMRNPKDYEPLTIEEGIHKLISTQYHQERGGVNFIKGMCLVPASFDHWEIITGIDKSIYVKHFHVLQNVHFALTGVELSIINCR